MAFFGPMQISSDHWRYRLLHWYSPNKDENPDCLYTHYCPLFHLTNLLALVFPFCWLMVKLFRLIEIIIFGIGWLFDKIPVDWIFTLTDPFFLRWDAQERADSYSTLSEREKWRFKQMPRERKVNIIAQKATERSDHHMETLDNFINWFGDKLSRIAVPEDDWQDFYVDAKAEYDQRIMFAKRQEEAAQRRKEYEEAAKEAAEERKKKFAKLIGTISVYSSLVVKTICYILAGIGVCLAGWGLYLATPFIAWFAWELCQALYWLYTVVFTWWFLVAFCKASIAVSLVFFALYIICKKKVVQRLGRQAARPLVRGASFVGSFLYWIESGLRAIFDFIEMFYEENCPVVTYTDLDDLEELLDESNEGLTP